MAREAPVDFWNSSNLAAPRMASRRISTVQLSPMTDIACATGQHMKEAKLSAVKVVRQTSQGAQTTVVDVDAIMNRGRPEKDMFLEPDDWVIVPERGVLIGN